MPLTGFTLIETLVAIAILTIAMVGPFYAVKTALSLSYVARDQLIASSLAQEGIEYVRSIRDNNYLNGRAWTDGLSSYTCYTNPIRFCTLDPSKGDIHTDSPDHSAMQSYAFGSIPFLMLNNAHLYTHQSGNGAVPTRFKRYVQFQAMSPDEVRVVVSVTWTTFGSTYTVRLQDSLHNWI